MSALTSLQPFGPARVMVTYSVEHDFDHHGCPTAHVYVETFNVNGEEVQAGDFASFDLITEWEAAISKEVASDATLRRDDARIAEFEYERSEA